MKFTFEPDFQTHTSTRVRAHALARSQTRTHLVVAERLGDALRELEGRMGDGPYLAGDRFSLADVSLVTASPPPTNVWSSPRLHVPRSPSWFWQAPFFQRMLSERRSLGLDATRYPRLLRSTPWLVCKLSPAALPFSPLFPNCLPPLNSIPEIEFP